MRQRHLDSVEDLNLTLNDYVRELKFLEFDCHLLVLEGVFLPSWYTHRVIGGRVCGYYNSDIDGIVDGVGGGGHDVSRYDVGGFAEAVEYVRASFGEGGLCYFILHHYLDRLLDILVMSLVRVFESYKSNPTTSREAALQVKGMVGELLAKDPSNVLSLIVCDLGTLLKTLKSTYSEYSRWQRERKRAKRERLLRAFNELTTGYKWLLELKPVILKVLEQVRESLDCILHTVYAYDWGRVVPRGAELVTLGKRSRLSYYRQLAGLEPPLQDLRAETPQRNPEYRPKFHRTMA